jgi:SNF2 family DNA or RNA helicase
MESASEVSVEIFELPPSLEERMFQHQREGVLWLKQRHEQKSGAILGDDMGLGYNKYIVLLCCIIFRFSKTFQTVCLIAGLMRCKQIKRVLIVCPVSVMQSWFREVNDHVKPNVKGLNVDLVSSDVPKRKREQILR